MSHWKTALSAQRYPRRDAVAWCEGEVFHDGTRARVNRVVSQLIAALRAEHEDLERAFKQATTEVEGGGDIRMEDLAVAVAKELRDAHGDDQLVDAIIHAIAWGTGVY